MNHEMYRENFPCRLERVEMKIMKQLELGDEGICLVKYDPQKRQVIISNGIEVKAIFNHEEWLEVVKFIKQVGEDDE